MDPLVERETEETLLTDWLELIEVEVALLARREERESESDRAGKVREELDADEVSVRGRDDESLALRWPRRASPSRSCEDAVRPKEGILEPVEGLESDALELGVPAMGGALGSRSASDGVVPDCESLRGVHEVRRDAMVEGWDGL